MCISSFHLSYSREIVPRISNKLAKFLLNSYSIRLFCNWLHQLLDKGRTCPCTRAISEAMRENCPRLLRADYMKTATTLFVNFSDFQFTVTKTPCCVYNNVVSYFFISATSTKLLNVPLQGFSRCSKMNDACDIRIVDTYSQSRCDNDYTNASNFQSLKLVLNVFL